MKVRVLLALCAVLFSLCANAQTPDRIEVFGGYSHIGYYYYPAYTGPWTLSSFNGWETSAAFKIIPHLAAEADFGGLYGAQSSNCSSCSRDTIRTYMGGPRVAVNSGRATFYAHVLFGGLTYKTTYGGTQGIPATSNSDTTFAMAIGGGADLWFTRRIGARLVQFDYLRDNSRIPGYFAHPGQHANFRLSAGVVFRF
jgi:hypothetical protein